MCRFTLCLDKVLGGKGKEGKRKKEKGKEGEGLVRRISFVWIRRELKGKERKIDLQNSK